MSEDDADMSDYAKYYEAVQAQANAEAEKMVAQAFNTAQSQTNVNLEQAMAQYQINVDKEQIMSQNANLMPQTNNLNDTLMAMSDYDANIPEIVSQYYETAQIQANAEAEKMVAQAFNTAQSQTNVNLEQMMTQYQPNAQMMAQYQPNVQMMAQYQQNVDIEQIIAQNEILMPETTFEIPEASLSQNDILAAVAELKTAMKGAGTDEAKVNKILSENGYSASDIVKIMDAYEKENGKTLMSDIQGDFSGREETALREHLYNAVSMEAENVIGWQSSDDIPEDIVRKANDFYKEISSSGHSKYMKKFDTFSDKEKAQILVACDLLHSDKPAITRITDKSYGIGKEDEYVDHIMSALKKIALG